MRKEPTMRPRRMALLALVVIPLFILFIAIGGEVVALLWNWLLPPLFGWAQITYWQALGILALCRILFGGFGGAGLRRSSPRRRTAERWENLTPEERERFRQGTRGLGSSTSETKGQ
jgi:hypothetical protein